MLSFLERWIARWLLKLRIIKRRVTLLQTGRDSIGDTTLAVRLMGSGKLFRFVERLQVRIASDGVGNYTVEMKGNEIVQIFGDCSRLCYTMFIQEEHNWFMLNSISGGNTFIIFKNLFFSIKWCYISRIPPQSFRNLKSVWNFRITLLQWRIVNVVYFESCLFY